MLWGYTAVSKLHLQTEVAKLLREYCDKGDPKVIAFTVIIQFTSLQLSLHVSLQSLLQCSGCFSAGE